MAALGALSAGEQQVILAMRALGTMANQWELTVSQHVRQQETYLQLRHSYFQKVTQAKDSFLAID